MSVGAMTAGDFKPCALCGRGVMHAGVPIFYRMRIESMGINLQEVQRTAGMEQFMGGHVALARVFHDPDIATPIAPAVTALVCQECSVQPHIVARLSESQ